MVEFGLKLEDNKVAEWSEHYIAYEKLKQILKKAAAAATRFQELKAKQPERASQIQVAFQSGLPTPLPSADNLKVLSGPTLAEQQTEPKRDADGRLISIREHSRSSGELEGLVSEQSTLLAQPQSSTTTTTTTTTTTAKQQQQQLPSSSSSPATKKPLSIADYGSSLHTATSDDAAGFSETSSSNKLSWALERAASGVQGYFQKSFERQVRDSLREIAKYSQAFEDELQKELAKVNAFYDEKQKELEERLEFLIESVVAIYKRVGVGVSIHEDEEGGGAEKHDQEDDDAFLGTPLLTHRKKSYGGQVKRLTHAIAQRLINRTSTGGTTPQHSRHVSDIPLHELGYVVEEEDDDQDISSARGKKDDEVRLTKDVHSIQRALVDQYRTAKLLHNFAIMNYTGFVKICKKHGKTLKEEKDKYKQMIRPENVCDEGKTVEQLIDRMERLYANWFCDRNLSEARAQMLPKKGDSLQMDWSQLRLGYRMGMCSVLGLWVCWDCVWGLVRDGKTTIGGRTAFPVFRGCGGLVFLQWFWGCSVWVWTRYRVNYIYIMDLNPTTVESPLAIFNEAVDNTLVFLISMLLYYKAGAHDIPGSFPAGIFPGFVVIYTFSRLIFPLRIRKPMWHNIWRVCTAPTHSPTFFHNYIGDIFTSMVKVFQDLAWAFCFMISGDWLISEDRKRSTRHAWARATWYSQILIPLLTLLPLWFRFNQCLRRYTDTGQRFPHLANAFKYALSQTVTLFGAFHPLYLARQGDTGLFQMFWGFAFVASSLYSFFWDVYMDWGLGRPSFAFLGPRLMYPHRHLYYVVIAIDLVLRFAWVLTLVPPESGANFALPAYLTAVSMTLELFRRTIWGFLRLENEHRSNTAGFRRVAFVPLHFTTGHEHEYKQEREHRGTSVLFEVAIVTILVLGAAVVSVVAAQHATQRMGTEL